MSNKTQNSKSTRSMQIIGGIAVVAIILGLLIWPRLKQQLETPLGPELNLPTYTPTQLEPTATELPATETARVTETQDNPGSLTHSSTGEPPTPTTRPTSTTAPSPTPEPLCGGPPTMYILGVGVDTEDNSYTYGLGDAIRIARIDFVTPKVTVLSLPRDLWVEIPGISDHYGITHGKLNQSYLYGSPGMGYYDESGEGAGLMARTLDTNFGLRVDHYGAVNMYTFARIVDAVGGIDLYLPEDIDGTPTNSRTEDMGIFYAGDNHFNGDKALRFSRIRKRYNDFTRQDHQTMVLCALKEKLINPTVLPRIPQIIASFKDSVITDLSIEEMSQLACLLPHIKRENLIFTSLPQEIFTPDRVYSPQMRDNTFIMNVNPEMIRIYIDQFKAGNWPDKPKEPSCP